MPRPKHVLFWNHFEKIQEPGSQELENKVLIRCKYCEKTFSGSTSVSRIRSHLTGERKKGISVCDKVPNHIKGVKLQVEDRNKRQKTTPSSSNCLPEIESSAFPERQDHEVQNQLGNGIQGREQLMEERNNFPLPTAVVENNMGSIGRGGMEQCLMSGGVCGGPEPEVHRTEGNNFPLPTTVVENNIGSSIGRGRMEQSLMNGGVCGGPEPEVHRTEGLTMFTSTPVGYKFESHLKKLWSCLMDESVLSIGICGMGGVGKTELAKHINNKLLKESNSFHHVFWVGVPVEFSVSELQSSIADALGFSFSNREDENKRAAKLGQALTEKGKSVLVLDNLWNYIDVKRIGIPLEANGCKLLLTSRSSKFCRMTGCQEIIEMDCLRKDDEAWELFMRNLGHLSEMTSEIEKVAKSIVTQCEGLPLGIITIARSMKDVNYIREWRYMLEDLKAARPRQEVIEIFESLRLSYDGLNDSILQRCLLTCALHDDKVEEDKMNLDYLIAEGINEGAESGQLAFDKAHSIVRELVSASLLKGSYHCIRMHNLIRIMVFKIIKEREKVLLEFGNSQLKELPRVERWTNDLTRVLFVGTGIERIDFDNPPRCPNLAVMLLRSNYKLEFIQDSFFRYLQGLQVLDLSDTSIDQLPNSVSDLLNLTTLLLRRCEHLKMIASLAELKRLKKLDMSYSGVEELPEGMKFLTNLNYLNLYGSEISELPNGMLANFSSLQFLILHNFVNGEELATLRKLEILVCCFNDISNFNTYAQIVSWCSNYRLSVQRQTLEKDEMEFSNDMGSPAISMDRSVRLMDCNLDAIYLPSNIQKLSVKSCNGGTLFLRNAHGLKDLVIDGCNEIEYLTSLSSSNSKFQSLESLLLRRLEMLRVLVDVQGARIPSMPPPTMTMLPPNALFSQLKKIIIVDCPRLKNLFPSALLPMLQNLEDVLVNGGQLMEEIVQVEQEGDGCSICHEVVLPKLKKLKLRALPKLKSICNVRLVCDSLQSLTMDGCEQLSCISLSTPIQSLKKVKLPSANWWRRLCSVDPNAKTLLQPWCELTWIDNQEFVLPSVLE